MAWVLDACFGAYYAAQSSDIYLEKILSSYYFSNPQERAKLAYVFTTYYRKHGKCQPKSFKTYVLDREGVTYISVPKKIRILKAH